MNFNPDKTEIMLFSNTDRIPDISFSFDGKPIFLAKSHRHLGVIFNSDGKWNEHINNIISSVTKQLNVLRKLKYRLKRENLEKIYLIYIRPIFEYACEV